MDWFATLARGRPRSRQDFRMRARNGAPAELVLVLLDTSGSTLRHQGLMAAKGLLAMLFETSYRRRVRVALMQFGGREAAMLMPARRPAKNQRPLLEVIHGGGGTPLRRGLEKASLLLRQERLRNPQQRQTLLLMTDGRSRDSVAGLEPACPTVVVDTEAGSVRLGRCRGLAEALGADYVALDSLPRI